MSEPFSQKLICQGDLEITKSPDANSFYQGRIVWNDTTGNEYASLQVSSAITTGSLDIDVTKLQLNGMRVKSLTGSLSPNDVYGLKISGQTTTAQKLNIQQLTSSTFSQNEPLYVNQNSLAPKTVDAAVIQRPGTIGRQTKLRLQSDIYGNNSGFAAFDYNGDNIETNAVVLGCKVKNPSNFNGTDLNGMSIDCKGLVNIPGSLGVGSTLEVGSRGASFDRTATQYMTLPSTSITFTTTGATFVSVVSFTGTPGNYERAFEFATGSSGNNSFSIGRSGTSATLHCAVYNGTTQVGIIENVGTIVQNVPTIIAAIYTNTSSLLDLYQDGVKIGSTTCTSPVTDKSATTSGSYIGRSTFSSHAYSNYILGGLFVYNLKLTAANIASFALTNFETVGPSFLPTFFITGQRIRYLNNQKISNWNGAYQTTTSRQPTAKVVGLLYNSSGLSIDQNLNVLGDATLFRLGVIDSVSAPKYFSGSSFLVGGTGDPNGNVEGTPASIYMRSDNGSVYTKTGLGTTGWTVIGSGFQPVDLLPITLDKTNNRVGINQTSPNAPLEVNGNIIAGWGTNSVAIGTDAGWLGGTQPKQKSNSVAIGASAGSLGQDIGSVAVGFFSGNTDQASGAVAIGNSAGQISQGARAVAVGLNAGKTTQGSQAIALGYNAGLTNQHENSIILNANGTALNSDGTSRFYVKPIRENTAATTVLGYDSTTGEISYRSAGPQVWKLSVYDQPLTNTPAYYLAQDLPAGKYIATIRIICGNAGGLIRYTFKLIAGVDYAAEEVIFSSNGITHTLTTCFDRSSAFTFRLECYQELTTTNNTVTLISTTMKLG